MKNMIKLFVVCVMLIFSLAGCRSEQKSLSEDEEIDIVPETDVIQDEDFVPDAEVAAESKEAEAWEQPEPPEKETFSFDELKQYEFWFSSGAGAWATTLNINPDGSFYGEYSDSDMGSTGDGYPDGTLYWCDFSGQFTEPVRVNEYTYSMQIAEINYEQEAGSEEILDGRRYCYSDAYGLENTENILIYLPGAPLTELSEEFRIWIGYYNIEESGDKELPFYALNNEAQQYGFVGYDTVENLKDSLEFFAQEAAKIEDSIQNDPLTQLEYNEKTKELYDLWDMILNDEWRVLKRILDKEEMNELTAKQREWIAMKEQEVERAGSGCEGGSAQSMIMNQRATELTKERVYELLELLE